MQRGATLCFRETLAEAFGNNKECCSGSLEFGRCLQFRELQAMAATITIRPRVIWNKLDQRKWTVFHLITNSSAESSARFATVMKNTALFQKCLDPRTQGRSQNWSKTSGTTTYSYVDLDQEQPACPKEHRGTLLEHFLLGPVQEMPARKANYQTEEIRGKRSTLNFKRSISGSLSSVRKFLNFGSPAAFSVPSFVVRVIYQR